ncbi:MAG: response regulator transcription factor [Kutzneria sp.]|nr:response regulator transcription factor [Kutzneria sp.]MBV9847519.1 response regulator transcription factor [Kutzneria sp.]
MTGPVLIIDDHAIVAISLALALKAEGLEASRCPVDTLDGVLAEAGRLPAGLALVDLELTDGARGADLVGPLRAQGWQVLVLTGTTDRTKIADAVAAGALGWVSKAAPFAELVKAVLSAARGQSVLAETERAELAELHRRSRAEADLLSRLTARERAVLDRLAEGWRAARIAEESVVSLATVRSQIRSILAKLEVGSQLEAVALARSAPAARR